MAAAKAKASRHAVTPQLRPQDKVSLPVASFVTLSETGRGRFLILLYDVKAIGGGMARKLRVEYEGGGIRRHNAGINPVGEPLGGGSAMRCRAGRRKVLPLTWAGIWFTKRITTAW